MIIISLAISSIPNQVMNSGTAAINGMVRSICSGTSKMPSPIRHRPGNRPIARPIRARLSDTGNAARRSRRRNSSAKAETMSRGEGSTSGATRPKRDAACQVRFSASGTAARSGMRTQRIRDPD